ncbi:putative receptor protein kinase ZmPK1 [Camellia lanceoleosa]|uniref:Receptor protein kinase ZmPK1 n=1 Tax=Camellia lanceoleosa TaxID=1840588 RepID=A0ACC0HKZ9_9ERIC|nr:putative receptor protein kinase ZmPK1 [Camellia lanceoleosa]
MSLPLLILFVPFVLSFPSFALSTTPYRYSLSKGSSLSPEKLDDVLISPTGVFSAGFYSVGDNAYCFAIWFSEPLYDGRSHTIVWMANRDQPINGRLSELSLLKNGDLVLTDDGQLNIWATNTKSISSIQLLFNDTDNLVLLTSEGLILWQSFDSPTDTLLPTNHSPETQCLCHHKAKPIILLVSTSSFSMMITSTVLSLMALKCPAFIGQTHG